MIYVLFNHGDYRIIDAEKTRRHNSSNGRTLIRLRIDKTIENHGLSDILFTNHTNGEVSYIEDDIFSINDTKKIISYIFEKMMLNWWER